MSDQNDSWGDIKKYKTNYDFYAKDEFGDDDTPSRDKRRHYYRLATKFLILFDVLVQWNIFTSMYILYFFMPSIEERFLETFSIFAFGF
jgi:hypothetical protein